jgi:uncharacterized membrane protein YdjX (TVP38/TMEM64 family)
MRHVSPGSGRVRTAGGMLGSNAQTGIVRATRLVNHARLRRVLGLTWFIFLGGVIYAAIFHRAFLVDRLGAATTTSIVAGGALYLLVGSLRGFTLIPATSLVIAGIVFFPPWPLFVLTLAGILISSASIYYFSGALHLEELLNAKHARQIDRLRALLDRYGLPVIIGWAFFPLAPTDLICYLAGALRIRAWICLLGVAIGEGAICGVYIFLGNGLWR